MGSDVSCAGYCKASLLLSSEFLGRCHNSLTVTENLFPKQTRRRRANSRNSSEKKSRTAQDVLIITWRRVVHFSSEC
jgi:hypothetical protein